MAKEKLHLQKPPYTSLPGQLPLQFHEEPADILDLELTEMANRCRSSIAFLDTVERSIRKLERKHLAQHGKDSSRVQPISSSLRTAASQPPTGAGRNAAATRRERPPEGPAAAE